MDQTIDITSDATVPTPVRFALGQVAPSFALPDTSGTVRSLSVGTAASIVVFTSNHCPFALAWHDRIVAVMNDYRAVGVESLFISSNDAERSPDDGLAGMRRRVAEGDFGGIPFLRDESQEVARSFGATNTPDVFVLDSTFILRWRGAPDSDCEDPSENARSLRMALDSVLAGRRLAETTTFAVGCPIKWRGLVDPFGPPPPRSTT